MSVMTNAREHVERLASRRCGVEHAIGRQQRNAVLSRKCRQRFQNALVFPQVMALDFDEEAVAAKDTEKSLQNFRGRTLMLS
jgi:hypothetical protein